MQSTKVEKHEDGNKETFLALSSSHAGAPFRHNNDMGPYSTRDLVFGTNIYSFPLWSQDPHIQDYDNQSPRYIHRYTAAMISYAIRRGLTVFFLVDPLFSGEGDEVEINVFLIHWRPI